MKKKPLHPLQIQILMLLYNRKLTPYKISACFSKPYQLVKYHVDQLFSQKLLLRKEKPDGRGFLYYTNKRMVKLETKKDKKIIYIRIG